MKTLLRSILLGCVFTMFALPVMSADLTRSLKEGNVQLKSVGPMAFGPEGILFVADPKAATIYAIATEDTAKSSEQSAVRMDNINQKIAALLGTTPDQILIEDLAVNPVSRRAYFAVSRGRGPEAKPVLLRLKSVDQLEEIPLAKVKFSQAILPDAPTDGVIGEGRRASNPRQESITDIGFLEDRVLVAGLANEEFASTLRAIPFPFRTVDNGTSVEIYHGAHGRFETKSPVRTFVPIHIGTEPSVLAAYTCTPLVRFPLSELKPNAKIKGHTIAELGNRNRPLDMIVYQKDGHDYVLIANSSRGIMKVDAGQLEKAEGISDPVPDGQKKGVKYESIEKWTGVDQLDKLDPKHALVIRRGDGATLNLETIELP